MKWELGQPTNQMRLVQDNPEIYYCLPTFIDRRFYHHALDHCLFWRPESDLNPSLWYHNEGTGQHPVRTPYCSIKGEMRWGYFVESVFSCEIGRKLDDMDDAKDYLVALTTNMKARSALTGNDTGGVSSFEGFYLLYVHMPNKNTQGPSSQ